MLAYGLTIGDRPGRNFICKGCFLPMILEVSYKKYYTKCIMKRFIFDRLVDRENICNLKAEQEKLFNLITKKANIVLYAPRNFGKTSVLKNIIIPDFKKRNKKSFVFFADCFQVKDLDSLILRLANAFERSFEESFPIKNIIENVKTLFSSLRPEISIDPHTGNASISVTPILTKKSYSIHSITQLISDISQKIPCLIIIDEFQDIAYVPEAEAMIRTAFQSIDSIPIILSGSKKHILTKMFANPDSPLAFWGVDVEFIAIEYEEYYEYIQTRFKPYNIHITSSLSIKLQDFMQRIPEPVNILCQQIIDTFPGHTMTEEKIYQALYLLLENRESRYESFLGLLSSSEEKILICLAKTGFIEKIQSREFVGKTGYTPRTVGKICNRLIEKGIIEKNKKLFGVTDPLLKYYLIRYR